MAGESVPDIIGVEFELTPEDWIEVQLEHSSRSILLRQARRNVRVLFGLVVGLLALLSVLEGASSVALTWLLAGGVAVAALGPILRNAQRKQLRRFSQTGIANGMFGHHRVELRADGILDATSGYELLTRWSSVERVEESEGAFLVYWGPNAFLAIPHTAFPDSETLRRFADAFYALRERAGRPELPAHGAMSGEGDAVDADRG
jgi:YcxB-like protein